MDYSTYVAAHKKNEAERKAVLEERRRAAHVVAQRIAAMLRRDFGAADVYLFGSSLRSGEFHALSDIDLAAAGIPSENYFAAVFAALRLGREYSVDLLQLSNCRPALRETILREGIKL